jgi:hypothetical protein
MSTNYMIANGDPLVVTQAGANSTLSGVSLLGVIVNTTTGGTLTITDSPVSAGSRTLLNAMPLSNPGWITLGLRTVGAVTITVGGTATVTMVYKKD